MLTLFSGTISLVLHRTRASYPRGYDPNQQTGPSLTPNALDHAQRQCSPVNALHPSGRDATWYDDKHHGVTCIQLESFASFS